MSKYNRPEITVVNHYNVFPFNHGGTLAIRGLYHALSRWFDINIIAFVPDEADYFDDEVLISKHIKVYTIVLPEELSDRQGKMYDELGMNNQTFRDSTPAVIRWYHKEPEILKKVGEITNNSLLVIAEHCYTWRIIKAACSDKHIWYRSQNVEYDYKNSTYKKMACREQIVKETYEIERECCVGSEKILTISAEDIDRFAEIYAFDDSVRSKFMNIRLGYEFDPDKYIAPVNREKADNIYSFSGFFISSNMESAQIAAREILNVAREIPDLKIYIAGRVCSSLIGVDIPENVEVLGLVSEQLKEYYLTHCDFALNPVESGAGVNVKMLEYFAFGIPVIATKYGARGIDVTPDKELILAENHELISAIRRFMSLSINKRTELSENAKSLLLEKYSWRNIAAKIKDEICRFCAIEEPEEIDEDKIKLFDIYEQDDYDIEAPFYIRGAGNYGSICYKHLKSKNLFPRAYIDNDPMKIGGYVNNIPVISVDQFFESYQGELVVVAMNKWMEITKEMIIKGLPMENIVIAFLGNKLFHLSDCKGRYGAYYNPEKIKKTFLRKHSIEG